jgi:hypothetical protein
MDEHPVIVRLRSKKDYPYATGKEHIIWDVSFRWYLLFNTIPPFWNYCAVSNHPMYEEALRRFRAVTGIKEEGDNIIRLWDMTDRPISELEEWTPLNANAEITRSMGAPVEAVDALKGLILDCLRAEQQGKPEPELKWWRNGVDLPGAQRVLAKEVRRTSTPKIEPLTKYFDFDWSDYPISVRLVEMVDINPTYGFSVS